MNMVNTALKMIQNFGCGVTVLLRGEKIKTRALIQPLCYKNKMYTDGYYLPQGYCDGGHYLYIGPPGVPLDDPDKEIVIACETLEKTFMVKRAETYLCGGHPVYIWAVITPCVIEEAQYENG